MIVEIRSHLVLVFLDRVGTLEQEKVDGGKDDDDGADAGQRAVQKVLPFEFVFFAIWR